VPIVRVPSARVFPVVHSLPVPSDTAATAGAVVSEDESLLPQAPKVRDPIATRARRVRLLADLRINYEPFDSGAPNTS